MKNADPHYVIRRRGQEVKRHFLKTSVSDKLADGGETWSDCRCSLHQYMSWNVLNLLELKRRDIFWNPRMIQKSGVHSSVLFLRISPLNSYPLYFGAIDNMFCCRYSCCFYCYILAETSALDCSGLFWINEDGQRSLSLPLLAVNQLLFTPTRLSAFHRLQVGPFSCS